MKNHRTILIIMASATGHINPTFQLTHYLQKANYRIVYGVEREFEALLKEQGYEVKVMPTQLFYRKNLLRVNSWLERISEDIAGNLSGRAKKFTLNSMDAMNEAIMSLEPDMIILDSFISYNYWLIQVSERKIPVVMVQTTLATNRKKNIPPLTSILYPHGSVLNKLRIYLTWNSILLKRKLSSTFSFAPSLWQVTQMVTKFNKNELQSTANLDGLFPPSVNGTLELILAPKSFDWISENNSINQFYVGCQGKWRKEDNIKEDRIWSQVLEKMKQENNKIWVYCSLGTVNMVHNPLSGKLLQKISDTFALLADWRLILTTGMVDPISIENVQSNVYIFQKAPQLSILSHCKIMITHGGLNSVLEAIHNGVPMLVYPLGWDQRGIGARVAYHGLGIVGNIKQEKVSGVQSKLNALITNQKIKSNCIQWQQKIKLDDKLNDIPELLDKIIHK